MPYSGFWRRAIAFILDIVIISLPTALVFGPILILQVANLATTGANPTDVSTMQAGALGVTLFSWQIVSLVATWLYFAIFESGAKQSTWGKRLLGIKVIGINGERIGFGRATARFFCKAISYLVFYIGFIMAAFTNRKRTLHDMITETYVVKKSFEPGQELPPTKNRWLCLILVSILWLFLLLIGTVMSMNANLTPTQREARRADDYMQELSENSAGFSQPMRARNTTYFYTEDGYRAVVTDPVSNNKFTLFLQKGSTQTCCEAFPFGDCATTGFSECQ